ncbi:flagellar hook-associated protein 1 FlgK [Nitrosospira sp. Nl5]|uniref:flagellar hook-associated protein FlgK n=1 Tax=Nitrosospira sp. Nl5 TaxID=200120 RepID=UPI000880EABB|nr:flagellar hook-associated protein FlgK [Nitrosospira sp. Nl5]SCY06941.1 flagellar hook-associated protein 1 FlgK [Nitrosospira sp. Nl5]
MGSGIFGIGLSALGAAQRGLLVTGHNVSNAATPGYTRQQTIQSTNPAQATGNGFIGQGVQLDTVSRAYNQFLVSQVTQAKTESSQLDTYFSQMQQIDRLLTDPSGRLGLAPALQDFFGGLQDVATNPSEVTSRQSMLSGAEVLVRRFQSLDGRLDEIQEGVNTQITNSISLINTLASQIGKLNETISLAESVARGQPANDLRDQRDELVAQLSHEVRANVVEQSDGAYSIFIGSGQPLVVGTQVFQLAATASPTDAQRIEVTFVTDGVNVPMRESSLDGGKLGGLLQFRSESLDAARNGLGRVAIGLAGTFNEQHRLGQDMLGNPGGDFFTVPEPSVTASTRNIGSAVIAADITGFSSLTASDYSLRYDGANYTFTRLSDGVAQTFASFPQTVDGVSLSLASGTIAMGDEFLVRPTLNGAAQIAVAIQDTSLVAAAAPIRTDAPLANTGTGRISAGSVNAPPPPDPDLKEPVTLTFTSATTFDVSGIGTGNPSGVTFTPGGAISYNGWTVQITGSPQPGDTFSIGPNTNGVGDNRNALLLGAMQSSKTLAGGTASYQDAYGKVVSLMGNKTRELEVTSAAQANLLSQTQALQQSESGVNLDEEAANLLRYQQAYQAASKIIQTASLMFDTLLELGR